MQVGTIQALWRYPVKSMAGEKINEADVEKVYGIPGDRGWAIRDEEIGEIRGAKNIRELLQLSARYLEQPQGAQTPAVEIDLGNGGVRRCDDPNINEALSTRLKKKVSLWPRQPADNLDHYRRVEALDETEMRRVMGLLAEEPLPEWFEHATEETLERVDKFVAPPGVYFDGAELHLISTTSLATLSSLMPESVIDSRRFRPNIVLDSAASEGFPEMEWCGRHLQVGTAVLKIVSPMVRCSMVTHTQGELPKDPKIMRTLVQEAGMNFGVALWVIEPGTFKVGDPVELVEE